MGQGPGAAWGVSLDVTNKAAIEAACKYSFFVALTGFPEAGSIGWTPRDGWQVSLPWLRDLSPGEGYGGGAVVAEAECGTPVDPGRPDLGVNRIVPPPFTFTLVLGGITYDSQPETTVDVE